MKNLKIDDFSRIVHVTDPQITQDGEKLAFTVIRPMLKENRYKYEIWVVNLKTQETTYIISSRKKEHTPRWSPSGKKLIFISRRGFKRKDKGNAIYLTVLAGEPRLVARRKEGFEQIKFLNENEIIALSPTPIRKVDEEEDYVDIRDLPPWFDKSGFIDEYRTQIFLIDVRSGQTKQLTKSEGNITFIEPSNTGDKIAYIKEVDWRNPLKTEVRILNIKTGEDYQVVEPKYNFRSVGWSPNDKHLVLHGNDIRRGLSSHNHIWITKIEEKATPINLTEKLDRNTNPAISCDILGPHRTYSPPQWRKEDIYFIVNNGGRGHLYKVNLNREIKPTLTGEFAIFNFNISKDGEKIALMKVDSETPTELYLYENKENKLTQITHFNNWFKKEIKISKMHNVKVKVSDGKEVEAWYIEPINKKKEKSYPAILFIHGGPKSSFGPVLNFMHQLMAANNYYVLLINPRGSDGYTEEFADIREHYGERDYKDIIETLNQLLKIIPNIDKEKLGVTGISYGGFMTNWIITQTNMFKAAVSENGIADWIADFWSSDIGYYFDPDQIGSTPIDNIENYTRQSPVYYVKNVNTPVLLIHSMEDYRCFIDQSLAFHIALKFYNKESRLIIFNKGSHGHSVLANPRHRKKRYKIILEYFNEKLAN